MNNKCIECNKEFGEQNLYNYRIINNECYCSDCARAKSHNWIRYTKIIITILALLGFILGFVFGFMFKTVTISDVDTTSLYNYSEYDYDSYESTDEEDTLKTEFNLKALFLTWSATIIAVFPLVCVWFHLQNQNIIIQQNDLIIKKITDYLSTK